MTRAKSAELKEYLEFSHRLADISGAAILPYFRKSIAVRNKAGKTGFDPVTAADRAAERAIRKAVTATYPEHGIVGEEFGQVAGAGRLAWVIDPIDGTRAFITGSPLWGTLIGLLEAGQPVVGLMDQPFTGERFWGGAGKARSSTRGGTPRSLKTRPCATLAEAVLTTTHPDMFSTPGEQAALQRLKGEVRMTRFGGDCYGYCLLASGFIDLIVEVGLKTYDVAALVPIIEGAGGRITTWEGNPATSGGRIVAAGDARVHKEALAILRACA
ncbi:MAG TPA: histidinol-phosphatase [Hyphomicrobiaceae bacterium]|nr:histidinol-phosphatase [Hyphomicrobiaceae bacterium]